MKLTGVLDTSDVSEQPAVAVGDFSNNDTNKTLRGFRVDAAIFAIGNGIEILLSWASTNSQQIMPLSGRGRIDATADGGFIPDSTRAGYTGNINLSSSGYTVGTPQNFTILLRLVKLYRGD